jgi:beta-lactam-binding protein with PASTA domain
VRVTQSLGPQRVAIPNIIGQPERAATIAIRRAGFDLRNVAHMPWAGATADTVIAQNPAPDAEGIEQPSMSLLIADAGPATQEGIVMPDLTGQPIASATAAITSAGLKLAPTLDVPATIPPVSTGNAAQPSPAPIPPGTVISQNPSPGHRVDASIPIQLTVAR